MVRKYSSKMLLKFTEATIDVKIMLAPKLPRALVQGGYVVWVGVLVSYSGVVLEKLDTTD